MQIRDALCRRGIRIENSGRDIDRDSEGEKEGGMEKGKKGEGARETSSLCA
jgi:hypothetical protein